MIDWPNISTVFLDMDGTLLDLHFDNQFWQEHVPLRYAEKNTLSLDEAKTELYPRFQRVEGTMDWYCVDYWSRELDLDIAALKHELKHLIAVHPSVERFLRAVRGSGRRLVLVTNAHQKSLSLKMAQTSLAEWFDELVCAHDYVAPKEDQRFWHDLQQRMPFDVAHTLMVDDSIAVLKSARQYGIKHLLAISHPDSKAMPRNIQGFDAIRSFAQVLPIANMECVPDTK